MTNIISVDKIDPNPKQPRRIFKEATLRELGQSIKEHGLVQPIVVEPGADGRYILIAGERRLRASKLVGLATIKAVVQEATNHNGREKLLSAIIENVQREDMNPIDEALAYEDLQNNYNLSPAKIAHKVGTNSKRVYDMLALLKLDKKVQELIATDQLTHDKRAVDALLKISKPSMQVAVAQRAVNEKLRIKTIVAAAERASEILRSEPTKVTREQIPALRVARPGEEDPEKQPPKWNVLAQVGKVPAWPILVNSAKHACERCPLRDVANDATCRPCALTVFLRETIDESKAKAIL